jgi:hypothetical protein
VQLNLLSGCLSHLSILILIHRENSHDFNSELDAKSLVEVRPKWMEKPILGEWSAYAEEVLGMLFILNS